LYKKVDWCCMIGISFDMRPVLEEILERIAEKDPTFRYTIYNSQFPQYDQIIVISSETNDQAHKRGLLFCKKYAPEEFNLTYWVKPITQIAEQIKEEVK